MESSPNEATITHDFPPFFRVYKDGRVERFMTSKIVPASTNPLTGVQSKDVVISPETGVSARLYMPKITNSQAQKLPLLVYIHGGGFCVGSAFSLTFHTFLNSLVNESKVVAISIEYRLGPEHLLPIAYDDSWTVFQWVVSHSTGTGPECWLNDHADFQHVFLAGESAGATIAHDVAIRAGEDTTLHGVKIVGLALVHPYFGGKEVDRMYQFLCPSSTGFDDPKLYPALDPRISKMVCTRVLVFVAEKDGLRDRGRSYYEALKKSGWAGAVEIVETDGEGHAFHLFKPSCEKTVILQQQLASFLNQTTDEITHEFPPFFKVHKDGRIERYTVADLIPPAHDPKTGVQSKDVVISPDTGLSARLFIPKINGPDQKLPLLVHYHGGGFCIGSPFDVVSKNFLTSLASQAQVIAVSVDYRLAPEHPLPIAYDDSWAALQWIATHSNGAGPVSVLNEHVDFDRVFLAGESAGANIAHHVAVRAGTTGLEGAKIAGVLIMHPFFGDQGKDEMYKFMCPTSSGCSDDPKLNPAVDPNLSRMAGNRVLVCLAEKDGLKSRGSAYFETLGKSGWNGSVDLIESEGEDHCFHLFNPNGEQAPILMERIVSFINQ